MRFQMSDEKIHSVSRIFFVACCVESRDQKEGLRFAESMAEELRGLLVSSMS